MRSACSSIIPTPGLRLKNPARTAGATPGTGPTRAVQELEELCEQLAFSPERFMRIGIGVMLANPEEIFKKAADCVFEETIIV
jgi:hypothetical protein